MNQWMLKETKPYEPEEKSKKAKTMKDTKLFCVFVYIMFFKILFFDFMGGFNYSL